MGLGRHFLLGTGEGVPLEPGDFPLEPVTRLFQKQLLHQGSGEWTWLCLFCFFSLFPQDVFGNSI